MEEPLLLGGISVAGSFSPGFSSLAFFFVVVLFCCFGVPSICWPVWSSPSPVPCSVDFGFRISLFPFGCCPLCGAFVLPLLGFNEYFRFGVQSCWTLDNLLGDFGLSFRFGDQSVESSSSKFNDLFQPSWAYVHFIYEGDQLKLRLDNFSGAGFQSKSKYMFGKVNLQIKLVEGDSAGTVTAFYMSSEGPRHNEFDFEFLGNTSGEPYLVQTNVYVNGVGNREQRLNLWFDPTKDFHTYSILWNQRQVVFLVDETPIRVHSNLEHRGIPYPKDQAMGVYSSIWNADDWATQGGRVKTDWTHAPFVASYRGFDIDACEAGPTAAAADNMKRCSSSGEKRYWWDEPTVSELNLHQSHQLIWVRANHLVYDYCTDTERFPATPEECVHHRHLFRRQGRQ